MNYSPFFSTIHDESAPVGRLGRGTHYSVLRTVAWEGRRKAKFHDFAVVWDEDHDLRVVWVLEQMLVQGLLEAALVVGERKGGITVLTHREPLEGYSEAVEEIASGVPSDSFSSCVERLDRATGMIINDSEPRVRAYLQGIVSLWELGARECVFTTGPFEQ